MKPKKKNHRSTDQDRKKKTEAKQRKQDKVMRTLGVIALVVACVSLLCVLFDFIATKTVRGYFGIITSVDHLFNYRKIDDCDIYGEWYSIDSSVRVVIEKGQTPYTGSYVSYYANAQTGEYEVRTDAVFTIDKKGNFGVYYSDYDTAFFTYKRNGEKMILAHGRSETLFSRENAK